MDFAESVAAIDARIITRMIPTLDRMRALAGLLAQPQASYPTIHVTGTNGKTSTARVATEILRALGFGVGTYTSPHLHSVRERIAYDGEPIGEADFAETYAYLEPYLAQVDSVGERVTWFETMTAMAEVYFAERAVDVAVVEVGMGGEWDATNLVDGRVAVVTEVAVDHPELGSTPVEVAREKVGVIKHGGVCVTGERSPDVLGVIRTRCAAVGATLRRIDVDFSLRSRRLAVGGQVLDLQVADDTYREAFLPLFGACMANDALLGVAAVSAFLGERSIDESIVSRALARVSSPGRLEVVHRDPLVVLDGAHNPDAAASLADALTESFAWDELWLVVAILGDKDVPGVLRPLVPLADHVIATQSSSPRAAPAEQVAKEAAAFGKTAMIAPTVEDALAIALERADRGDAVCVTGSLYTVAQARSRLLPAVGSGRERA
jgi:dihydrofolate synthase/folylpolyglutamate synthase